MPYNSALAKNVLEMLKNERPKFHGRELAGTQNWAIQTHVLEWLAENLPPDAETLETGCGYSTVIFACLANNHISISPFTEEHDVIKLWCKKNGIHTKHINFIPKSSQDAVHNLKQNELDFILIDGDHAFPAPFIDWYYTADMLKVGGYIAVDDTQIPTGKILRDFLSEEYTRWKLIYEQGNTSIFTRISNRSVAKGIPWTKQPFCQIKR